MKELIKITEQNGKRAVSARELHRFLESKQEFATWIKNRIEKYGFVENQDFEVFDNFIKNPNGGRPLIEYALTIECEKLAQNPVAHFSKIDLAHMVIESEREKERLQIQNELQQEELKKQAPKVAYYNEVLQSQSTYNTNQIAKELGMSAVTLNKKLRDLGVQYKQGGTWLLYHRYQNKGYTKTQTYTFADSNGNTQTSMQTVWTEEGRLFIHDILKQQLIVV